MSLHLDRAPVPLIEPQYAQATALAWPHNIATQMSIGSSVLVCRMTKQMPSGTIICEIMEIKSGLIVTQQGRNERDQHRNNKRTPRNKAGHAASHPKGAAAERLHDPQKPVFPRTCFGPARAEDAFTGCEKL